MTDLATTEGPVVDDPAEATAPEGSFVRRSSLRPYWWAVSRSVDLVPGAVAPARVLGTDIVLWRTAEGRAAAALDRCPHREAPLSLGRVTDDGCIECPYHGWRFDADGTCVEIPSQRPGLPVTPRASTAGFRVRERYGLVWVCLGEPAGDVIAVPEADDPAYRTINAEGSEFACSAGRVADNFLDASHFAFLHLPTFGSATDPVMPTLRVDGADEVVSYRYELDAANPDYARTTTLQGGDVLRRTMTMSIHLPFTTLNTVSYATGLRHVILNATTPIDDERTLVFMTLIRNDDHASDPDEAIALDRAIVEEDKVMLERIPGPLPLDTRALVHAGADRASVEWIRRLARLLAAGHDVGPHEP